MATDKESTDAPGMPATSADRSVRGVAMRKSDQSRELSQSRRACWTARARQARSTDPRIAAEPPRPRHQAGGRAHGSSDLDLAGKACRFAAARWVSRAVLLGILMVQAMLSLQLQNTAFADEALYLYAGHLQLDQLLDGRPLPGPSSRGTSPARPCSTQSCRRGRLCIWSRRSTGLEPYSSCLGQPSCSTHLSRLLFNELAGLCAAALFGTTQSTLFLGHFATYDAMAIFLLALAAWIVVRSAQSSSHPGRVLSPHWSWRSVWRSSMQRSCLFRPS